MKSMQAKKMKERAATRKTASYILRKQNKQKNKESCLQAIKQNPLGTHNVAQLVRLIMKYPCASFARHEIVSISYVDYWPPNDGPHESTLPLLCECKMRRPNI